MLEADDDHEGLLSAERTSFDHDRKSVFSQRRFVTKDLVIKSFRFLPLCAAQTFLYFLAIYGLYHLVRPLASSLDSSGMLAEEGALSSCSCGSSLAEATALNCQYDSIAAAWLPPHCRDDELTAQFDAAGPGINGNWIYYADELGHSTISTEEIALLPDNEVSSYFFTTHRWHVLHCSYYWRKLHRMVHGMKGAARRVEHRFDTEGHINHCEMMFLKRDALDQIVTGSGVSLNADIIAVHED